MPNSIKDTVYQLGFFVKSHDRKWVHTFMTDSERRELMNISMSAYILFEYYLQNYQAADLERTLKEMNDARVAVVLGWAERRVADVRRILIKEKWIYQIGGRLNNGRKILSVYIGKNEVKKALAGLEDNE